MFKNTLFLKIILVFTLPALGMMYFSTVLVYEKVQTLSSVSNIDKNTKYLYSTKALIDAIEQERFQAIKYQLSKTDQDVLFKAKGQTDSKFQDFLSQTSKLNENSKEFVVNLKTIQDLFYNLKFFREKIKESKVDSYDILEEYSNINTTLITTLKNIKPVNFAIEFNTKLDYLIDLIVFKEYANIESTITNILVKRQDISNRIQNILVANYTVQDVHLKRFLLNASVNEINKYSEAISLSLMDKIIKTRNSIKQGDISQLDNLKILEDKVQALQEVYEYVHEELKGLGNTIEEKASIDQILSLTFLFVSFVTLISLLFVLKNIIFNEQKSYNKINKQREVYKLLNATNNYLLTTTDEKKLYKEICKLIGLTQSMSFGFVYKVGKNGTSMIAQQGTLKDILDIKLKEETNRKNLLTKALEQENNVIIDNFSTDKLSVLSSVAKEYNLKSAAAFPIKRFDRIIAVLVLYSNEANYFDEEIEILFNNMINDMTHTLEKLKYEKSRIEQEHELKIASYAFESNEPMIITDRTAHIIKANQAFCDTMGYKKDDVIGRNPNMFKSKRHDKAFYDALWKDINEKGSWTGEIFNTKRNKQIIPLRSTITSIKNSKGVVTHYLAQYLDISEQIDKQKVLEYQATHDNLTGLPNRLLLMDRIERAITKVERHNIVGGLVFIDLDNFKEVNDTLGHEIGDKLLIMVAKKIRETIRKEDTIARIGGDEFIVLADHIADKKEDARTNMLHLAEKIKLALNSIIEIDGHKNISTPSIGVTLFSDSSISINDIIKQADTAMYEAKKHGKNSIEFFK